MHILDWWQDSDGALVIKVVGGIVIGVMLFIGGIAFIDARIEFPAEVAAIEQCRADIAKAKPTDAHDLIGQATKFNQDIQSARYYRSVWWGRIFYAPGWEAVKPIDISVVDK